MAKTDPSDPKVLPEGHKSRPAEPRALPFDTQFPPEAHHTEQPDHERLERARGIPFEIDFVLGDVVDQGLEGGRVRVGRLRPARRWKHSRSLL